MVLKAVARVLPETDSKSGSTPNSWSNALEWDTRGLEKMTIVLSNTHSANGLTYQLLVMAHPSGMEFEEVDDTNLSAGSKARFLLTNPYAKVKLQVKSQTAGQPATWQVDYIGQPTIA